MAELEQFCILAKAQKGRACATLIQQVGMILLQVLHSVIIVRRALNSPKPTSTNM